MIGTVLQHLVSSRGKRRPAFARRALGCSMHERRVTDIALRFFDLLQPIHRLSGRHRDVLRLAALVHDCGRRFGARDHHISGAQLVIQDKLLQLSPRERRSVAYLVRYHCGKVPSLARSEYLRDKDRPRKVRLLLAMLRAADGLDSRRVSATAIIVKRKDRRLRVQCWVDSTQMEKARKAFLRRRKYKLLERSLDLDVSVRLGELLTPQ